jgi:drug/metabolite transporter (DMT)-like permease
MLVLAALVHSRTRLPRGLFWPAAANGVIAAAGLTLYMFATRQDIMAVAVVLSSLYPVIPVVLGIVVLRERLSVWQAVGFAAAASTVVLVTIG